MSRKMSPPHYNRDQQYQRFDRNNSHSSQHNKFKWKRHFNRRDNLGNSPYNNQRNWRDCDIRFDNDSLGPGAVDFRDFDSTFLPSTSQSYSQPSFQSSQKKSNKHYRSASESREKSHFPKNHKKKSSSSTTRGESKKAKSKNQEHSKIPPSKTKSPEKVVEKANETEEADPPSTPSSKASGTSTEDAQNKPPEVNFSPKLSLVPLSMLLTDEALAKANEPSTEVDNSQKLKKALSSEKISKKLINQLVVMDKQTIKTAINNPLSKFDAALQKTARQKLREEIRMQLRNLTGDSSMHHLDVDESIDSTNIPTEMVTEISRALGINLADGEQNEFLNGDKAIDAMKLLERLGVVNPEDDDVVINSPPNKQSISLLSSDSEIDEESARRKRTPPSPNLFTTGQEDPLKLPPMKVEKENKVAETLEQQMSAMQRRLKDIETLASLMTNLKSNVNNQIDLEVPDAPKGRKRGRKRNAGNKNCPPEKKIPKIAAEDMQKISFGRSPPAGKKSAAAAAKRATQAIVENLTRLPGLVIKSKGQKKLKPPPESTLTSNSVFEPIVNSKQGVDLAISSDCDPGTLLEQSACVSSTTTKATTDGDREIIVDPLEKSSSQNGNNAVVCRTPTRHDEQKIRENLTNDIRKIDERLMELNKERIHLEEMIMKYQNDKIAIEMNVLQLQNERLKLLSSMTSNTSILSKPSEALTSYPGTPSSGSRTEIFRDKFSSAEASHAGLSDSSVDYDRLVSPIHPKSSGKRIKLPENNSPVATTSTGQPRKKSTIEEKIASTARAYLDSAIQRIRPQLTIQQIATPTTGRRKTIAQYNQPSKPVNFIASKLPINQLKAVDDFLIAASEDGNIYKFNIKTGKLLATFSKHTKPVTGIYVDKTNVVYSIALDGVLRSTSLQNFGTELHAVYLKEPLQCFDIEWAIGFIGTRSGNIFVVGTKSKSKEGDLLCNITSAVTNIIAAKEGPRKIVIVATKDDNITIRDASTGLMLRAMQTQPLLMSHIFLNETRLYVCATRNIYVYDFITGDKITMQNCGNGPIDVKLYDDRILLIACCDGYVYAIDKTTGHELGCFPGTGKVLLTLEVAGDRVITASQNNSLQMVDIPKFIIQQLSAPFP